MATTTATRRLTAILAADVVGYSRLMGADEEGTHERFKAHLVELIDPKIREHRGRIVKTTGDGEQAIRRSPLDPQIGTWYASIGLVHLLQSRTDEAITWLEKGRSAGPAKPFIRAELAAAYGLGGDLDRAATELAAARKLRGEGSFSSIAKMKTGGLWRSLSPKTQALYEATYFAGLRKAGMPEE